MKIKIEFTQEEKMIIANAVANEQIILENKEVAKGKFGDATYDPSGYIEINITTKFIAAFGGLVSSIYNMIKSMFFMYESFIETWFDTETKEYDKDGNEIKNNTDEIKNKEGE